MSTAVLCHVWCLYSFLRMMCLMFVLFPQNDVCDVCTHSLEWCVWCLYSFPRMMCLMFVLIPQTARVWAPGGASSGEHHHKLDVRSHDGRARHHQHATAGGHVTQTYVEYIYCFFWNSGHLAQWVEVNISHCLGSSTHRHIFTNMHPHNHHIQHTLTTHVNAREPYISIHTSAKLYHHTFRETVN